MASPLATIRKYDKVLLAVFGVLLMLSFLIADPLSMLTGTRSGATGRRQVAPVTFRRGSLSDEQLQRLHLADMLADQFLRRVLQEADKNHAQPRMFPHPGEAWGERQLVENYLLARKAHELGLSMSNDDIDDLVQNMAGDSVEKDEIRKIRKEVVADWSRSSIILTEQDLYSQLRTNFLAQELLSMVRSSAQSWQMEQQYAQFGITAPGAVAALPPAEGWELFRRTARQATVELLPLEVEKFVDDVTNTPTARKKDELFEKYKDYVPAPFSPDPGLATPHKISFGYVRVDFQPFLDRAKSEVTEEAIRADYEERLKKGEFTVPVETKEENKEGKREEKETPDEKNPDDKKPDDDSGSPNESKPEDKKPGDDNVPEENSVPEENGRDGAADCHPDEEQDVADEAEKTTDAGAKDETSSEPKPPEDKTPTGEEPSDAPDDKQPEDKGPSDKRPSDKKPKGKNVETRDKTYEEMEETIREQLAQKPAQDAQREAMKELFDALKDYLAKYDEWKIEKEAAAEVKGKEKQSSPAQPELMPVISGVLKKYDFKYQQTDMLDAFEIEETEIGKASVGLPNQQQIPLPNFFMYEIKLYEAFPASEGFLRDTQFIFWKEADQPQRAAERKEVEEQLVRAAKLEEAFKLAKARAEELAAKAREQADQSLRKSLGPVEKAAAVVEPPPFSWLSSGGFAPGGMGMLQPSDIPEVSYPGDEFMQTVLDLQPGEIGVAADQPHKRVYVIRLISQSPKEDILRQMFLTKGISDHNISQQHSVQRLQSVAAWISNVLEKDMQLQWNRPPQRYDRS